MEPKDEGCREEDAGMEEGGGGEVVGLREREREGE